MSKERPILFNGEMVRAILAGQKTQTRRAVKLPRNKPLGLEASTVGGYGARDRKGLLVPEQVCIGHIRTGEALVCPFGQPGDRLWVRESFTDLRGTGIQHRPDPSGPFQRYAYSADTLPGSAGYEARKDYGIKWRPSIHMPREACRLVLEITAVRVERLRAITVQDIAAEGISCYPDINPFHDFEELWTSTGGDWASNPWVWVLEFKQVTP